MLPKNEKNPHYHKVLTQYKYRDKLPSNTALTILFGVKLKKEIMKIEIPVYSTKVSLAVFLELLKNDFPTLNTSKLYMHTSEKKEKFYVDILDLFFERNIDGKIIYDCQSLEPTNDSNLGEWIGKKFFPGEKGAAKNFENLILSKNFSDMTSDDLIEIDWLDDYPIYEQGKSTPTV